MSLYKRGGTWWFKFRFEGQVIRESAKTASKTLARETERARRRDLETAVNRIQRRERMPLFKVAAEQWVSTKTLLAPKAVSVLITCAPSYQGVWRPSPVQHRSRRYRVTSTQNGCR